MSKKGRNISARIVQSKDKPIKKAEGATSIKESKADATMWISPPADMRGYQALVDNSTILPQCISAYKNNIVGFGIGIKYKDDIAEEQETAEMKEEYDRAAAILDLLTIDKDTKELFEDLLGNRETYGIAYLEIIRNFEGNVEQIEFIRDTPTVRKTIQQDELVDVEYFYKGELITRKKRFRRYKQEKNGKTVFFKEFGDPRIMNLRTGEYLNEGETLDYNLQANEILEFPIGTDDYGKVRWIGQVLGIDGARKAENLNNNYFINGRHTPLAIIVKNGTLSDDSYKKMQEYMEGIRGENGQHAFLLLEVEETNGAVAYEENNKPDVELKDLASILQKDELFQEYLNNSRRKVQSAFRLPDLYVGYTTDFNRATAQTAMEVTEEQVFQPERKSLAWIINNKLLNGYQFKYVEVFFREPDISNPDDLQKILNIVERAGGLTPNKAKEIALKALGETSEDFDGDWGNIPLAYQKIAPAENTEDITEQLNGVIMKAANNNETEIVAVMKEVRALLLERGDK